jgi:DNA-binding sugar fermentation-stimulating protein
MADLAFSTGDVAPVQIIESFTGPCDEAVTPGQVVRFSTSTGKITSAKGTESAETGNLRGVCIGTAVAASLTVTAVKRGILNMGTALGGMDYDAAVYLSNTDGKMATSAGSVSTVIGYVCPAWGVGTAVSDKLLYVAM